MFKLKILTFDQIQYEGESFSITLPGSEGSFEVLAHHSPLIAYLIEGTLIYVDQASHFHSISVNRGVVDIRENQVTVFLG